MGISRRTFIGGAAAVGAFQASGASSGGALPSRVLGRTGANVSILAFGSGSRFLAYKEEEEALAALNHALDLGITYVDTAIEYGNGLSETRIGKVLKTRRKGLWLATKVNERNGDEAMRAIEASMKRLGTQPDLIHIHSLTTPEDLAAIEAPGGVLKRLYKLREEKVIRAVGVSCHTDPAVLKTALERNDFDCTQMALNAARVGMANMTYDPKASFETLALPVANRKKMGVIAMKIFAQDKLTGKAAADDLIRYSMSLPVTSVVIGMPKVEHIEKNTAIAKSFSPLAPGRKDELSDELSTKHKAAIDRFFAKHQDA